MANVSWEFIATFFAFILHATFMERELLFLD